jgi:hypothetical protein
VHDAGLHHLRALHVNAELLSGDPCTEHEPLRMTLRSALRIATVPDVIRIENELVLSRIALPPRCAGITSPRSRRIPTTAVICDAQVDVLHLDPRALQRCRSRRGGPPWLMPETRIAQPVLTGRTHRARRQAPRPRHEHRDEEHPKSRSSRPAALVTPPA